MSKCQRNQEKGVAVQMRLVSVKLYSVNTHILTKSSICIDESITAKMDSEHLHKLNITAQSGEMPAGIPPVSGIEWNDFADHDITVAEMVARMKNTGFQATAVAEATEIIDEMVSDRSFLALALEAGLEIFYRSNGASHHYLPLSINPST